MHRDTGYEVRPHLARYEWAGEGVAEGAARALSDLLRRQLRKLLCQRVMVLREPLDKVLLRLLLFRTGLLLPPARGLSSICQPVEPVERMGARRVLRHEGLREGL